MIVVRRLASLKMRGKPVVLRFIRGVPRGWKRTDYGECRRVCDGAKFQVDVRVDVDDELKVLDRTIHELTHAGLWDLDEEVVEEFATDLSRFLWRLGWRLKSPPPP